MTFILLMTIITKFPNFLTDMASLKSTKAIDFLTADSRAPNFDMPLIKHNFLIWRFFSRPEIF